MLNVTKENIFDFLTSTSGNRKKTFADTRKQFLERHDEAAKALSDFEAGKSPMLNEVYGWLKVIRADNEQGYEFRVRPGYGGNNQLVQDSGKRLSTHNCFDLETIVDARNFLAILKEMADEGDFDENLRKLHDGYQAASKSRVASRRKKPLRQAA